jgi:hypothetical protein
MLEQLDEQVDAEEDSLGHPSTWRSVYNLMRCPGPPCPSEGYYWQNLIRKKHYKLNTHQLESLVRHVQKRLPLETHDDVPDNIRQQLYAEEQQRLDRKHKVTTTSSSGIPPITINNVLLSISLQHRLQCYRRSALLQLNLHTQPWRTAWTYLACLMMH